MTKEELYIRAKDWFGLQNQVIVAIEEASEFQKELTKKLRNGIADKTFDSLLADEIADLTIMIEQITLAFNLKDDIESLKKYKLNRLAERIECRSEFSA